MLQTHSFACPYCGETQYTEIDCSVSEQEYIEDCQVCCRPVSLCVNIHNNEVQLLALGENE